MSQRCFQWFKDTNLKANHNMRKQHAILYGVVFNGSKILIWKQITTERMVRRKFSGCFQWFKDTNLKANHNRIPSNGDYTLVVFNGSKILIWKQITTEQTEHIPSTGCFQWFKDTNLKANHNLSPPIVTDCRVVFNGSKILIWKQITTSTHFVYFFFLLFSMVQRY